MKQLVPEVMKMSGVAKSAATVLAGDPQAGMAVVGGSIYPFTTNWEMISGRFVKHNMTQRISVLDRSLYERGRNSTGG